MGRLLLGVASLAMVIAVPGRAGILFDNGPWITGRGNGFGGADTSRVQAGASAYGYNTNLAVSNRFMMADDFVVPGGEQWDLATLTWYAWQTGSTTTSTITEAYVTIWDGDPSAGGSLLYGDEATNRLSGSSWSGV